MQFLRKTLDLNYIYPKKKKKTQDYNIYKPMLAYIAHHLFCRSLEEKSLKTTKRHLPAHYYTYIHIYIYDRKLLLCLLLSLLIDAAVAHRDLIHLRPFLFPWSPKKSRSTNQ